MSAVELEIGKADFDFYAKFAKPLILSLTNTEDRILASAWFSKLRDEASGPEKLRLDYLKLLLFVLQRHRLAGPFIENPNIEETLQTFGDSYDLPTIARQIIEKEQNEKKEKYRKRMRGEIGDFSPYSTDYSPDLREYVAAQDIPNFGVHVYYAISKDPILDWDNAHHAVFPKAVKRMEPQGHLSETSFAVMEPKDVEEEIDTCKILEETGVMPDESIFLGQRRERERKSPYVYMDRPAPALGILPGEGETEVIDEELPPPTWGSNLIEVREPIDMERPDTGAEQPDEQPTRVEVTSPKEADPEDPGIVELLETSFNMEDILAEVDAIETEDFVPTDGLLSDEDDEFAAAEVNFQDVQAMLDQQDAAIAAAMAELDEDELKMLAEMEAEDKEAAEAKKHEPKQEVKVLADEDTVIKLLVEEPGSKKETAEEKDRKAAKKADEKKKKPAGRTGLNKGKAKGALLKECEKKALENEEKKAKVVATKTGKPAGGPSKRPGVPKTKPSTSKTKVVETASTGKIPTAKPSDSGIPAPGKGIPRPAGRGIPRPAGSGIPRPGQTGIPGPGATETPQPGGIPQGTPKSHMEAMKARLEQMMQETRESFPEEFIDEGQADIATAAQEGAPEQARRVRLSPIHEVSMTAPMSPGSPESDDIFDEMEREYLILERLYELYEQIAPDVPDELRTPPPFSKHPQIKALGRKMKYRAQEFDIHPLEEFQSAQQYFAEEGRVAPSPFVDPREAGRMGERGAVEQDIRDVPMRRPEAQPPPEATPPPPERSPPTEESPPWAEVEDLKKICERAERRVDISPAISGGVGVTTPKSPATPRRPAKRDLRFEFELESPPPYESPPVSPEKMTTPEFVRVRRYQLPEVITDAEVEKLAAERYPEYEAYMQAQIQAERDRWGRFAPGASPEAVPPAEPTPAPGTPSPRPGPSVQVTPPSAVPQMVEAQRTPEQLPPEYQYQYETPPRLAAPEMPEIPGSPVFEEFDPLAHEDITLQVPPDLVEADFDEFEQVHGSPQIQLQDWFDPMQAIADAGELDFGLDIPDEMMPELAPFEEPPPTPPPPPSPMTVLKQQLREHEIEPEFLDRSRPLQKSKRVMVASKTVRIPRRSRPTRLAKETIQEDYSGETFEKDEEIMEQEVAREQEQKFLEMVIEESERVDHLKQIIESAEAGEIATLEEEMPPELAEPSPPSSPYRSPIKTPERPVKPVTTPPLPPSRDQLMYAGTPERVEQRPLFEEELEFLASPGLPTPTPPRQPPPPSPPVPSPPPRGFLMWDSPPSGGGLFDEEIDESMLASPGMSPGRTLEEDLMELGTPTRLPAPFWEQPPTPSPPRPMPQPQPAFVPRPMAPLSPEIDAAALQRELRAHELEFRKAHAGGFRAGTRWVGRRSARNYQLMPIAEQLDYEGSRKMPPAAKDYHVMLHKLPPAPPPAPYPPELMDVAHEGRFYHPDTLLDQPIPYEEELPPPIEPEWQVYGWRTPPRLRPRPAHEPAAPTQPYAKASHASDVLLFEEPPEGIYVPLDEDVVPLELMQEGFPMTPPRPMPISPPRLMPPSPGFAIPTMTMSQQMMQATQMAQWQAERIASPPRPISPERIPSPPRRAAPPPAPYRSPQQARQPSPPAPHWSPQPGPSSIPHVYPYAPPAPPRQPSPPMRESPRQPTARPSPPRETPPPPQRPQVPSPVSPPRITKRVTEVKYTSQFYDPDSPEASKKWTKGRTMLQFNRPCGDQRPVQTPRPQGVAVYGTGPPASAAEYPPMAPMSQMGSPERAPRRRPVRFMGRDQQEGQTPTRRGGQLPRRRILEGELDAQDRLHRRNLLSEYMDEEPQEPVPLSPPPQVSSVSAVQGERIEVMEEYVETEHDFIPEHLRGFRWMDEPDEDYYSAFRKQFQR
ncbi:hypothetical protein WA026_001400 [Henosepilachna vigintioctopunctata]|uniref:DUF4485 domain-containing protein n=1 Tax=Henosepilachna vigintioctopunctata TaxID=420089 RepID=A0AAW1UKF5_9CUCU